jgi:putative hydrolase of the HAD superfamily
MRAVLFDLGDTLICPAGPWDPVIARACAALSETLCQRGIPLDCDSFSSEFATALRAYYAQRETSLEEPTTFRMLHELLASKGYPAGDDDVRAALDALYAITRSNWHAAEDALPALRALRERGLRLGLLSNAGDDEDVHILAHEAGVTPFLDFIVTSAQIGFRKPDLRTFRAALAHWNFSPGDVAMIGDRLDADVAGGKSAGLFTVWITLNPLDLRPDAPQPDLTISSLNQLPALLADH